MESIVMKISSGQNVAGLLELENEIREPKNC